MENDAQKPEQTPDPMQRGPGGNLAEGQAKDVAQPKSEKLQEYEEPPRKFRD
jgi:hypothetical protein